ncbi:hypothetical protein QZH41_013684 [Actinostola sp. cb2023]|nr:hypothetical protein QZH41_013684 [Actinostola sp. cb2023]
MIGYHMMMMRYGHCTGLMVFFYITACIVGMFSAMPKPCLGAQLSQWLNKKNKVGALFSVFASLESLCNFCSQLIFNPLYSWCIVAVSWKYAAGLPFMINAGLALIPLVTISPLEMLRTADSNVSSPWQTCGVCPEKTFFRSPNDFSVHLRQDHCTKEGGSFVCRYGRNGVCPSLPLDGVSDKDYVAHVEKNHIRLDKGNTESPSAPKEDSLFARPRIPPIVFKNEEKFTVYSATQNLPAVLNDPRYNKRHADFFTRTWGEEFAPHSVPPLTLLPSIPFRYFEDYLKKIDMRCKLHQRLKKTLEANLSTAQPGDTGFTAAAVAAAKRHNGMYSRLHLHCCHRVIRVFMNASFSLEDPDTFNSVLPWALVTADSSQAARDRAGLINTHRNSAKLLQEKLSHYLDLIEMNLAYQISLRSEDFFSAMASQDQLQDHVGQTITEITHLRLKVKKVSEVLCRGNLEMLRVSSLRSKYISIYEKRNASVQTTFCEIAELVYVSLYRHLGSQLAEMERIIEKMMEAEFIEFVTANLNRSLDEVEENGHLLDEDRLVSVLFGLLRKHKFHFIHLYRDEAYSTIKSTIKQTVHGALADQADNEEENQSIAEIMRGLDYEQWLQILQRVFNASLEILKRIKILHQSIKGVLSIAAGSCRSNSPVDPSDFVAENIRDEAESLQLRCDVDVLITKSEFNKLSQESKELLCAACEMAQVRCAKLINIRAKAGYLDSLTSTEFVTLTRMVEGYVMDCEGICGRQSHSLRATLLSQAKKFVERFHEERRNKLGLILDNERWKQADVPAEFQTLVDSLIEGINPRGKEPKFSLGLSSQESKATTSTVLIVNGEKFVVVGTVLLLLKMIVEYCQCVDDTPMLVTDIMNKLFEILKLFNSRTCQLVLGAGALQLVGLKTITVKHLALASRCLQVIALHLPVFKTHFEQRLPPKQYILLSQFDQIQKDYSNHQLELNGKIVGLMDEAFSTYLSRWEVKPPMPSQAMRSIVKQTIKLHESLSTVFSPKQIETLFKEIKRVFKNCLAEKLVKLGVSNDGGPQHGTFRMTVKLHGKRNCHCTARTQHGFIRNSKTSRHGHSTVTARTQHGHSTDTVRTQHGHSTDSFEILKRHGHSTVTARTQHGHITDTARTYLVTSDLAFFTESLHSLRGMRDIARGLDDVWRTVNELRTAKDSPSTVRKTVQQR